MKLFKSKETEPMKAAGMQVVDFKAEKPVEEPAQTEAEYDRRFFCICPKCDTKIYEHVGFKEHPEGIFNIFVTCGYCNHDFSHTITSAKGDAKQQANAMHPAARELMKKLMKDKGDE